ncbi:TPA: hypothetical protein L4936_001140 [Pseudomonas aeruginosa]|nr:hypothetical protein [Pseudomonas aeruginosa]HBO7218199.1 hypothetical protein [Pseudomonas aeruginosa]
MNNQTTKIQVLVLPAQEDIATFQQGRKPLNILLREFENSLEVDAYRDGHDAIEDLHIAVEELVVVGSKVTYNLVDSESDGDESTPHEVTYSTPAQAEAFRLGIEDAEGFVSCLVLTEDDDGFYRLKSYFLEQQCEGQVAPVPTIVVYKSGNQITRVVASQAVRVIVLDADGEGLEEDAPRTVTIDGQELYVTDLDVSAALPVQGAEHCVSEAFVQSTVRFVEAMPEHYKTRSNVPGAFSEAFPVLQSVPVKHWAEYDLQLGNGKLTHVIDIDDQRLSSGQFYLTVGAMEGNLDDMISVCAEVGVCEEAGVEGVPSLLVNFDADSQAFRLFKVADKVYLQPELGVTVKNDLIQGSSFLVFS